MLDLKLLRNIVNKIGKMKRKNRKKINQLEFLLSLNFGGNQEVTFCLGRGLGTGLGTGIKGSYKDITD